MSEKQHGEALRERQQLSAALNRINETIHASLDTGEILQHLVSEGAAALGCETAAISLREEGRWRVSHVYGFPDSLVGAQMVDDEERHTMLAIQSRRPVAIDDAYHDERMNHEHARRYEIRAVLVAPLILRDRPFGAIFFNYHSRPQSFSEAQIEFAAQLAATAAIALENGRLFNERKQAEEKIKRQHTNLRAVNQILEATLTSATEENLGEACLDVVERATGSQFGFIGEVGDEGLLRVIAMSDPGWEACQITTPGGHRKALPAFRIHGIYGQVILRGKGFFSNDPGMHPERIGTPPGHPPLRSFLGVPLFRDMKTIGMIAVANREGGYDEEQLETLEILAPVIVEAFLRKRAEAKAEEGQSILAALMESVPEGITIASGPEAEIRMVSRHGRELLGGPRTGLTAAQAAARWKVYQPDGITPMADADLPLVRAIQAGEIVRDVEVIQVGAAGQHLLLSCNAAPIRDRDGNVSGSVAAWRDVSELKEIERRHSRILASALNGFWLLDAEGKILEVNDALCRMLGYSRAELLGMYAADIEASETQGEVLVHIAILQQAGFDHFESRQRRKDGTVIDVEVNAIYLETGGGQVASFIQDISARKRAEEALQENREWLRVTLTSIGDGVIATDADGRVTFLNPTAESLTGWRQEEALGHPIQQVFCVINERSREPAEDLHLRVLKERCPINLSNNASLLSRDGREIPIEDSAAPILNATGNVAGVVLVFHDVTEKRRAREALRDSEERFRFVLENSLDIAYRRNLQMDRYDYMSPVIAKITGWTADEMIQWDVGTILACIHPEDRAMAQSELDRTWAVCEAGQQATGTLEYRFLCKDGTYRWLGDHINVLPDGEGRALYRLGIVRDITQRKEWERELERLNRTLRARSHSDRALLRAANEADLMEEVCRIIVEDCGHAMAWIGFAEEDEEKSVRPVAYAGFEEGYLESLHITWADTERGRGPTGTAVRTRKPSFCRNMLTDPQFEPWREQALERGYASSLVLPLLDEGKAFGALTIYFREPDPFTEDEVALLQGLADDLAYGIVMLRLREAHARTEAALSESEDRFRSSVENLLDAYAIYSSIRDDEGRITDFRVEYANKVACQLTGRQRKNYIGRTVLELYPDLRQTPIFDWYVEAVETGMPIVKENFAFDTAPHGRPGIRYFDYQITRLRDGFTAAWRDVTERTQAEEALRRAHDQLEQRVLERTSELQASEERFRQLAENIHEVFWMIEPETHQLLYLSPAFDAIWGRSREDLYKRPQLFLDTIHPDDREGVLRHFGAGWQSYNGEFRILHPDGTPRWIQIRSFPVYNEKGQVYRLAGIATDQTEHKAAESALLQAERLTIAGKLAASVAHEINNPLQAVVGCLGLARGAMESGQDPSNYLQIAHQEVLRTTRVVSQLRALGRPVQDAHKEPTDLNSLVDDVLALNKKYLQGHKVEVTWELDEHLPQVLVMPDSLRQVFLNLVLNAVDAMPEGGQLLLRTSYSQSPAGIRVEVSDSGSGIAPDKLAHIFEAFYSTKPQGLGVGLYLCQEIVKQHGGRIQVESELGKGATFAVWLPA